MITNLSGRKLKRRYTVNDLIGEGVTAIVYRAWDHTRNHAVALKFLRDQLARNPEFNRRFHQEAQQLASLQHDNIVRFYGFEQDGDLSFIVMRYIDGGSLKGAIESLKPEPVSVRDALQVAAEVGYASQGAFGRVFLQRLGTTPTQWQHSDAGARP